MRASIDDAKCQGHGRCYDIAPQTFEEDDEGYGHVVGDGAVAAEHESDARLAEANCPELAVILEAS